jgi:hypothetical protein
MTLAVLVMSDTHGLVEPVKNVLRNHAFSMVIHCGDYCTDGKSPPFDQMVKVKGNCDLDQSSPDEQIVEWDGLKLFVVHGHTYKVKSTPMPLFYRSLELGVHICCFGHTHVPFCKQREGVLFLNPGSLARPRLTRNATYAILSQSQGKVAVTYYDLSGKKVAGLGGVFSF